MKQVLLVGLALLTFTAYSSDKGNGGDICENKMIAIANDLESWLLNNLFRGIKLPPGVEETQYQEAMLSAIEKSTLSCTTDKVYVGKVEKTCKNFIDDSMNVQVVCNFNRFMSTEEKEKYKLMHHEFAGVSGLESNNGDERSVYTISDQLSDYLGKEEVLKLGIKKRRHSQEYLLKCAEKVRDTHFPFEPGMSLGESMNLCKSATSEEIACANKVRYAVFPKDKRLSYGEAVKLCRSATSQEMDCAHRVRYGQLDFDRFSIEKAVEFCRSF